MLLVNHDELARMVAEYRAVADASAPVATRRRNDLVYMLCVSTGTRTVADALRRAEEALGPERADRRAA